MKIVCTQQKLSRGLSVVGRAVPNRSTLPILTNVLLSTDNGHLKLSATNLEVGITCYVDAEILEEGSTTVPARLFSDFVSSLAPTQVELELEQVTRTFHVKSSGNSANIKGTDPSEFPTFPSTEGSETPVTLDAALLKEMISEVAFAAAPEDDSRPVFTGVFVEMRDEKLTMAAADSFRLAVRSSSLPGMPDRESILVPAKTLIELGRILPGEGTVEMYVTPNRSQVLFHTARVDLISRLIEGTFPNFRAIIPGEYNTRATASTKEFAAAVKSVTPFARDSSNIARIKIGGGGSEGMEPGSLTIEAEALDVGSNISTINSEVSGPEQQVIFNVKYLADVLSVIGTSEVVLLVTSPTRPGVVRPMGEVDYTYVIMPMSTTR